MENKTKKVGEKYTFQNMQAVSLEHIALLLKGASIVTNAKREEGGTKNNITGMLALMKYRAVV